MLTQSIYVHLLLQQYQPIHALYSRDQNHLFCIFTLLLKSGVVLIFNWDSASISPIFPCLCCLFPSPVYNSLFTFSLPQSYLLLSLSWIVSTRGPPPEKFEILDCRRSTLAHSGMLKLFGNGCFYVTMSI